MSRQCAHASKSPACRSKRATAHSSSAIPGKRRSAWLPCARAVDGKDGNALEPRHRSTPAINALLTASTGPLLVALATFALYRDRPTLRQTFGVLLSLAGVLTVICRGDLEILRTLRFNAGDVGFFAAQIIYAFYTAL